MNDRRVHYYVAIMCATAIACLFATDWGSLAALPGTSLLGLAGLVGVALLSESLAIGLSVGGGKSSITFLPLLASAQLFGPAGAIALIVPTMLFAEFVVRRKQPMKGAFNVAQAVVGATVAGLVFTVTGGLALESFPAGVDPNMTSQLIPFVLFGLVSLAANHVAVSMAITLSQGMPFRQVLDQALSNSGARLNDILISPIALAVAFLYVQFGIAGILVVLLPMLFIRYSYLTTSKLRESNEDLLTALVKAIETRDPYTSGHSQRVSVLASEIAEELGLNRISVERVRMSALLHDIGKIEAVYTDILRKPDSLTPEERAVIESHVTRGEQLLRDLSSVPEEVVLAVRHHHEREDGRGYPDGLVGNEIPIGAKIIVVCDAVDAMLSDRPYRKALPLPEVLSQLREHSSSQFDELVVKVLVDSQILTRYADAMRIHHDGATMAAASQSRALGVMPMPVPSMMSARPQRLRKFN